MIHLLIIDRFEKDRVIIECGNESFSLPEKLVPENAKEGDVLKMVVDKNKTELRKNKIEKLSDELFE